MSRQKGKIWFKSEGAPEGFILLFGLAKQTKRDLDRRFGSGQTATKKGFPIRLKDVPAAKSVMTKWGIEFREEKNEK